ncbi:MAG: hypothetical protein RLY72_732 [Planctomycetota bacterium]
MHHLHLAMTPLIIHIPHASTVIPPEALADYIVDRDELALHIAASTDHFTDRLFACDWPDTEFVTAPASRLAVDVERFEDDAAEPMSRVGLGVLYTHGHNGARIRQDMSDERRAWYLDRWYRPHHAALTAAVERALQRAGRALIIDAHSYPDTPFICDLDKSVPRPDGCIGTAGMHTHPALIEAACSAATKMGWSLGIDAPYAGGMVPMRHFGRDARVQSIMIELNRSRYMRLDGAQAVQTDGFDSCARFVRDIVQRLRGAANTLQ